MKRKLIWTIVIILLVAATFCCAFWANRVTVKDGSWYGESFNHKSMAVKLDSNPTTGYQWEVKVTGAGYSKTSEKYYANTTNRNGFVGGGGVWKARYALFHEGETTLTFRYVRNWEPNSPAEVRTLVVTADKNGRILSLEER